MVAKGKGRRESERRGERKMSEEEGGHHCTYVWGEGGMSSAPATRGAEINQEEAKAHRAPGEEARPGGKVDGREAFFLQQMSPNVPNVVHVDRVGREQQRGDSRRQRAEREGRKAVTFSPQDVVVPASRASHAPPLRAGLLEEVHRAPAETSFHGKDEEPVTVQGRPVTELGGEVTHGDGVLVDHLECRQGGAGEGRENGVREVPPRTLRFPLQYLRPRGRGRAQGDGDAAWKGRGTCSQEEEPDPGAGEAAPQRQADTDNEGEQDLQEQQGPGGASKASRKHRRRQAAKARALNSDDTEGGGSSNSINTLMSGAEHVVISQATGKALDTSSEGKEGTSKGNMNASSQSVGTAGTETGNLSSEEDKPGDKPLSAPRIQGRLSKRQRQLLQELYDAEVLLVNEAVEEDEPQAARKGRRLSTTAKVRMQNRTVEALVDTGADLSVISLAYLAEHPDLQQSLRRIKPLTVRAANAGALIVKGITSARVTMGSKTYSWEFIVIEDLQRDVILGCDFLEYVRAKIDMHARVLYHGMSAAQEALDLDTGKGTSTAVHGLKYLPGEHVVVAAEEKTVEPNTSDHLIVRFKEDVEAGSYFIKAGENWNVLHDAQGGLTVPGLVDVKQGQIFKVRVLNTADDLPWKLKVGDAVTVAEPELRWGFTKEEIKVEMPAWDEKTPADALVLGEIASALAADVADVGTWRDGMVMGLENPGQFKATLMEILKADDFTPQLEYSALGSRAAAGAEAGAAAEAEVGAHRRLLLLVRAAALRGNAVRAPGRLRQRQRGRGLLQQGGAQTQHQGGGTFGAASAAVAPGVRGICV